MGEPDYVGRMGKVMDAIKARRDFASSCHTTTKFEDTSLGYYYSSNNYFTIKHGEVEVTRQIDSFEISFTHFNPDTFSMDKWLSEVEKIVKRRTIVIDGKQYLLTEIK